MDSQPTARPRLRRRLLSTVADTNGNAALIFALCLIPIALLIGGGIDLRRMVTSKSYTQDATDAAVLAAAKAYFKNLAQPPSVRDAAANAAAKTALETELDARKASVLDLSWHLDINAATGQLTLVADAKSPAVFGGLFGISKIPFEVNASAGAGGKPVEIALILDNTSSMFQNGSGAGAGVRFTTMREAAKEYVNEVYDLGGDTVKISVVPWAGLVNINSEAVASADPGAYDPGTVPAAGSRRTPVTPYTNRLNVLAEPRTPTTALTAARLTALSAPTTWRGCIRSANNEVKVNAGGVVTTAITDAAPANKWPAALLEPIRSTVENAATTKQVCTKSHTVYSPPPPPSPPSPPSPPPPPPPTLPGTQGRLDHLSPPWSERGVIQRVSMPLSRDPAPVRVKRPKPSLWRTGDSWSDYLWKATTTTVCDTYVTQPVPSSCTLPSPGQAPDKLYPTKSVDPRYNDYLDTVVPPCTQADADAAGIKACLSDPNEVSYLNGGGLVCSWRKGAFPGNVPTWNAEVAISGPNLNCPTSILPLSTNRKQVLDKLNEMYPVPGGTLADVGLLWGLRTLSSNAYWNSFWGLSGKQVPAAFKSNTSYKIAILLSDGKNESPFWYEGYYGCNAGSWTTPTSTARGGKAGNCWQSPNTSALAKTQAAYDGAADKMMLSACDQMRNQYGVDLYYILVDVTDPNANALAAKCAPDPGHAISTTSGQLNDVFKSLVARSLRLTH